MMMMTMMKMMTNWNETIDVWIFVEMIHPKDLIEQADYDDDYHHRLEERQWLEKKQVVSRYFDHDHRFVAGDPVHDLKVTEIEIRSDSLGNDCRKGSPIISHHLNGNRKDEG